MSLSSPELQKPYSKVITFKGKVDVGLFVYYDKKVENADGSKGANVAIPFPVKFIVLDELSSVSGYSDKHGKGIYSNQVRNLERDDLFVRCDGQVIAAGKYKDIIGKVKGGRFCKCIYAALATQSGFEMVMFEFTGAALSAWFDFRKKNWEMLKSGGVLVKNKFRKEKKGTNEYLVPLFETLEVKVETMKEAYNMDVNLQKYLKDKFEIDSRTDVVVSEDDDYEDESGLPDSEDTSNFVSSHGSLGSQTDDDDLPF